MSVSQEEYLIPLSQGLFARVDAEDYVALSAFKWHAHKSPTGTFYARRYLSLGPGKYGYMYMHRQILSLARGDKRKGDHRDPLGTLDNRRANLRVATSSENSRNCRGKRKGISDIPKGVFFCRARNKWSAQIAYDGLKRHLGNFLTMQEAADAYKNAAIKHHGEFARVA